MELPEFFGLDIGNHSIKVVQAERNGDKGKIVAAASLATDFGLLDNASDQGMQILAAKIKEARLAAGIKTVNCVASIPESPVFSRLLTLPRVEEDKIQESVNWEIKPLIPIPTDEVDIAFLEIDEKDVNGQKFVNIFAVAAPKTLTDRYKKLAQMAEINLIALETEAVANTRAITFNYGLQDRNIMVFDFGAHGTDIVLARDGVPVFTQSVSTGSDALTKAVAADYGIAMEQAEAYKRAFGVDATKGEGKIAKSMEPIMQILLNEMRRTLTYFREKIGDAGTTKVYMCGEAAKLPGLAAYISQNLSLEAVVADPALNLQTAGGVEKGLQAGSAGFSVAIGLAIKDK